MTLHQLINEWKLFEGLTLVATVSYVYLTYRLVRNTNIIHDDLQHAEENYYRSIDRLEKSLQVWPNGAKNDRGVQNLQQEEHVLSKYMDEISALREMASPSLKLRMKKRFRTFIVQNDVTFNVRDGHINYAGSEKINHRLNTFYKQK